MDDCGLILLAAGASRRLGQAKQSLAYGYKTLFQHAVNAAVGSNAGRVITVYGAHKELQNWSKEYPQVTFTCNPDWEDGIASSITKGLSSLLEAAPLVDKALFMVCDQPFVTTSLLNEIIALAKKSSKKITACCYNGTYGTPAVFDSGYFGQLLALRGDRGAKKIISENLHDAVGIDFPLGHIDIDTKEDYDRLLTFGI